MSAAVEIAPAGVGKGSRKRLLLIAAPALLLLALAGLWLSGVLPHLLGMDRGGPAEEAAKKAAAEARAAPVYVELPEMIANLNAPGRKPSFVKLKARLELSRADDQAAFQAAQPRVVDLFQTYLREMRPEELRGSAGTYRLREELIARASLAAAPAKVTDVLFSELLVQ